MNHIRKTKKNIMERLKSDEEIPRAILKDIFKEYDELAELEQQKESEIEQAQADIQHLSEIKATSTRLKAIVEKIMEGGFDSMSFERQQEFLRTLYPFRHTTYNIKLWKVDKKDFYWESTGRFTEKSLIGCFNIIDTKGEAVETTVDAIIGRKPTLEEQDALMQFGLLDKTSWLDSDIKKATAIVDFYIADNAYQE